MISNGGRQRIGIWFGGAESAAIERRYRVAEAEVGSNQPIAELAPFEVFEREISDLWQPQPLPFTAPVLPVIYEGRGWIGGHDLGVTCRGGAGRYRLDLEHGDWLQVWKEGVDFGLMTRRSADDEGARFAVLGPGFGLALALGGRFSLHASAISAGGRCFLILGESGTGKSILAAGARARGGSERIADDVVTTMLTSDGRIVALPHFPQLKLPVSGQWQGARTMSVDAVLFLRREPAISAPRLIALSAREAVLRLVENTVASRLFDPELRVEHLDVCVRAAAATPVADLEIPDDLGRVAETLEVVESATF